MSVTSLHQPTTQPRFEGRSLLGIKVFWLLCCALLLGVTIAALPSYHRTVTTICDQGSAESARCHTVMAQAGISQEVRGTIFTATHIMLIAAFFLSGIVIYWQRPDERMALLTSLAMMGFTIGFAGDVLTLVEEVPSLRLPIMILRVLCRVQLMAFMFYFPTGRFVPRWTVWIVAASVLINALVVILGLEKSAAPQLAALINALIGLGTQVYRYQYVSGPTERLQTKWVLLGLGVTFVATGFFFIPRLVAPNLISLNYLPPVSVIDVWYWIIVGAIGIFLVMAFPISITLAVLRYRLWGADTLINRSLVYGGVTVLLGLVFIGGFFAIHALLERFLGSRQDALSAIISTALVVALFQPTLTRLRRLVDRKLYRIRIDYRRSHNLLRANPHNGRQFANTTLGIYENLEPLGQGGMAELYRAEHPSLRRPVAIKILLTNSVEFEDYRVRFEREAKAVAALRHPNIVQLYDYGETDDGILFMVMEYVNGPDLSRSIAERGTLPLEEVKWIVNDIASALDYAHQMGVVHRDVKPANVMLEPVTRSGAGRQYRAVLADFGLVKLTDASTQMTQDAGVIGTLDYIAPEQIEAQPALDGRADIYALAAMTYEMLTGKPPFHAPNPLAVLMMHLTEPPPDAQKSVPGLPPSVGAAIIRAMAKKAEHRYATAGEFSAALL